IAGINRRLVRSPPAPKMIKAQGGAFRLVFAWAFGLSSTRISMSVSLLTDLRRSLLVHLGGFACSVRAVEITDAPLMPFARNLLVRAQGVTAKAVPHQNNGARPIPSRIPRDEKLHNRLRDDRDRHFHAQRIANQPIHLAGILDI